MDEDEEFCELRADLFAELGVEVGQRAAAAAATERKPIFPSVEREVDITDGCAAQFHGRDNYHQVAEWATKVGTKRLHAILVTMHGKNICDSLSNVVHAAIKAAVSSECIVDPGSPCIIICR